MAIISGDRTAAKLSNLIDEGNCVDTYLELYNALKEFGIPEGNTRDDVKKAIMTYLYGSTARPEMLFGSHVDVFYMGINMLMSGVCGLNQVLLNMWNKTTLSHDWVLPDNFHVHAKVYNEVAVDVPLFGSKVRITREVNMPNKYGKATSANSIHSIDGLVVREVIGRCNYDLNHVSKIHSWIFNSWYGGQSTEHNVYMVQTLWNHYLKTGFLSVRILNYIDKGTLELIDRTVLFNLLETLPKKPFQVISIHD